jgi:hypothetical protein
LSDQQNPLGKGNLPGSLPGLGPRTSSPPLPGLGAKPGAASLPGLGVKPPIGAAPLPGAKPSMPPGAVPGLTSTAPAPAARPSVPPLGSSMTAPPPLVDYTPDPMTGGMPVATSSLPQKVVLGMLGVAMLFFGYNIGKAWSNRVQLNESLRDSLIVQYEVDKAVKLFDELDAVINGAVMRANKYQYDAKHLEYLAANVSTSPIKPQVFTERSYRNFGHKAASTLSSYGMKWQGLVYAVNEHLKKTRADAELLSGLSDKLKSVMKESYGVTFQRQGDKFLSNVVYLGKPQEKKGKALLPVGLTPSPTDDLREAFNPPADEGDDGALTKTPEAFVAVLAPEAKQGLLIGPGKDVFNSYVERLDDIRGKMKLMRDDQTSLTRVLAGFASQNPAAIAPPDAEGEFRSYVASDAKTAGAAPAPGK